MNEELLKRLDAIAAKLGVAAEQLWAVVLKQVQLEAWAWILVGVPVLLLASYAVWKLAHVELTYNNDVPTVFGMVACLAVDVVIALGIISSVLCLLNPEYYALKYIAGMLR